jgi:MFS family permease
LTVTNPGLRRTIFDYFAVTSLYTVADKLFGAVYIATMSSNGLSATQVGMVLMIGSLLITLFDFPSGNVADTYGRKKTTSVGFMIWGASLVAFAFSDRVLAYGGAMFLWALGVALISGAPQAWFVDELERMGEGARRKTLMPTANTVGLVLGASTGLITGAIASYGLKWPLILGGTVAVITGVAVALFMRENYGTPGLSLKKVIWKNTTDILRVPRYRMLLMLAAFGRVPFQVFVMSWQLYALRHLGLPSAYFGPMLTVLILTLAAGNALSPVLARRIAPMTVSLIGYSGVLASMLIFVSQPNQWLFLCGAALFELALGIHQGASSVWLHDLISSEQRTSFISALSSVGSLVGVVVPLTSGFLMDHLGFQAVWGTGAAAVFCAVCILAALRSTAPKEGKQ